MTASIRVIDVSALSQSRGEAARVAAEIGAACRGIGFFYVAGHPVPAALMEKAFRMSAAFFVEGEATKKQVLYSAASNHGKQPRLRPDEGRSARPCSFCSTSRQIPAEARARRTGRNGFPTVCVDGMRLASFPARLMARRNAS